MADEGYEIEPHGQQEDGRPMTVHETHRVKKAVETNVKAIENRIKFFQREEEKIWRDLEEVRRQASTIEDGRTRTMEKKLADRTIAQAKDVMLDTNRQKATTQKAVGMDQRKRNQFVSMREKQLAGEEQRKTSQDMMRQKRYNDAQVRLQNSERAVAIQRAQLEARLKSNQEKADRLDRVREQQEYERMAAEAEVADVEAKLPQLEAEEMICLQRLQNSRIVTQSVLEELESSLGARSSVTNLLRSKQRQQDHLDGVQESPALEDVDSPERPRTAPSAPRGGGYNGTSSSSALHK